jgi:hypothetical protein
MGGKGGTESPGGIPSVGGKSGSAGTPSIAGAGGGQAGEPGMCSLAIADCATPNEPACKDSRSPCVGSIASYGLFQSSGYSFVNDVAASLDGRVAVTGYHFGETYFGSLYYTTDSSPGGHRQRAYMASFGAEPTVKWVYQDPVPEQSHGVSLAFAANGDVLVQTRHVDPSTTGAGLLRLNTGGREVWRKDWGTSNVVPVAVAVDNDGASGRAATFTAGSAIPAALSRLRHLSKATCYKRMTPARCCRRSPSPPRPTKPPTCRSAGR